MRGSFEGRRVGGLEGLRGSCAYSVMRQMAPRLCLWVEVRDTDRWPNGGAKSGREDMPCALPMRYTRTRVKWEYYRGRGVAHQVRIAR